MNEWTESQNKALVHVHSRFDEHTLKMQQMEKTFESVTSGIVSKTMALFDQFSSGIQNQFTNVHGKLESMDNMNNTRFDSLQKEIEMLKKNARCTPKD